MRRLLILFSLIIGTMNMIKATDIKVTIENYDNDTLLLGYYYWDKQYIKDTIIKSPSSNAFRSPAMENSNCPPRSMHCIYC